jgi:hypothetical protein
MAMMSRRAFYILLEAAVVLGVVLGAAARVLFNHAMKQKPQQVVPGIQTISRVRPMGGTAQPAPLAATPR